MPPSSSQEPSKRIPVRRIMWTGVVLLVLMLIIRIDLAERAHAKAVDAATMARRVAAVKQLNSQFAQIAAANPQITLGIAVTDSDRGQRASYNSRTGFDAASTAKIMSAALYLNQIEKGQRSPATPIDGYGLNKALQLLIQQSDDNVWLAMNDMLGHRALYAYAEGLDLLSYDADTNTISAADMNELMMMLAKGNLLNQAHTELLLSFMQHTNSEVFIPPALEAGMTIYHKVGLDDDEVNDTAIIKGAEDDIVLTIYTNGNGTYDWPARAALMQHITHLAENAYLR